MKAYKTRKIEFRELIDVGDWKVKVYTISGSGPFDHPIFYQNVVTRLPSWLEMENGFEATNYKVAFLILHPGAEGIFSLINWWLAGNMRNTNIFITDPEKPDAFEKISGNGLASCQWELEIIYHESDSWTKNVLKKGESPDFESYLQDILNTEL